MAKAIYTVAERFMVRAECVAPLHVGTGSGEAGEVLIHPVKNVPFIQAGSICGVFRDFYEEMNEKEKVTALFGSSADKEESGSKVKFSDGFFDSDAVRMEIRPHVRLNKETGTVGDSEVKGGRAKSGQKFETEYVGAGNEFSFEIEVLSDIEYKDDIVKCLEAINAGDIQMGGHKSTGCGYIKIETVRYDLYEMRDPAQRRLWCEGKPSSNPKSGTLKIKKSDAGRMAYYVTLKGKTEGELLVKDISPEGYGAGYADAVNIRNAAGDYVIPGSSLKGAIRNRMEMIAAYKGLPDTVITDAFGVTGTGSEESHIGNLRFREAVVGKRMSNDMAPLRTRVHIDKFTGGAMNQGLFSEKNIYGELTLAMTVGDTGDVKAVDTTLALLVMALRDLAVKAYQFGSGYSVGKGYIDVKKVEIVSKSRGRAVIDFSAGKVDDGNGLLKECLKSLEVQHDS